MKHSKTWLVDKQQQKVERIEKILSFVRVGEIWTSQLVKVDRTEGTRAGKENLFNRRAQSVIPLSPERKENR